LSQSDHDRRIDYIEFPALDIAKSKQFYGDVFEWKFVDYGPDYTSFEDGRLAGGFRPCSAEDGVRLAGVGALVVIYVVDIETIEVKVIEAGGLIVKPTFEFPGGRRFHFTDPAGNELAVWSDNPPAT